MDINPQNNLKKKLFDLTMKLELGKRTMTKEERKELKVQIGSVKKQISEDIFNNRKGTMK
ncbi:MAG: hypothetical protein PHY26_00440 [Bacilli bacterium]|nr:hypothetical protein [Bacilli bacterium]